MSNRAQYRSSEGRITRRRATRKAFQKVAVIAFRQFAQSRTSEIDAKFAEFLLLIARWLAYSIGPRLYFPGGIKVNTVLRIVCLFLLGVFAVIAGFAPLAHTSRAEQDVQVIEVTAKKYEYTPSPLRVRGGRVQLKITSLDKTHGFKINLYPDGSDGKGDPGLIFSSKEDCFKIEKETPIVVQFVARTPGAYSLHCCNRCGIGHGGMKGQLIVEP
jgi:hypothetical protein